MLLNVLLALALVSPLAGPDDKEAEDAVEKFKTAYKSRSAEERAAAVADLAKVKHAKVLSKLAALVQVDDVAVRKAAAGGLGGFTTELRSKAGAALVAALAPNAKDEEVVLAIYAALGKLQDENALPSVHRAFDEKDLDVAKAAIDASGDIRGRISIEVLIELLKDLDPGKKDGRVPGGNTTGVPGGNVPGGNVPGVGGLPGIPGGGGNDPKAKRRKELVPAAKKALAAITKEKWSTTGEWEIWWGRNKATFKVEK